MKLNKLVIGGVSLDIFDLPGSLSPIWIQQELNDGGYGLDSMGLKSDDIVIDVGSNTGIFAIYLSKKYGCKVIGFEPVRTIYENAIENLKINKVENVVIHNKAIYSNKDEVLEIHLDPNNSGGSSLYRGGEAFSCDTTTLEPYIIDIPKIKLLKIDCEGCEYEIIPSILNSLNKFEYISIEYHKFNQSQDPVGLDSLIRSNFNGKIYSNDPKNPITG